MGAVSSTEAAAKLSNGGIVNASGVDSVTVKTDNNANVISAAEKCPVQHEKKESQSVGECPVKHDAMPATYASECPAAVGELGAGDVDPRNMVCCYISILYSNYNTL